MMASMNPQAGGPVGGGMVMMNNGSVGTPSSSASQDIMKMNLNTYIYEYFLKLGHYDLARALHKSDKFEFHTNNVKQSPGRKAGGDMNGDAMDMDLTDNDIPDDLPRPRLDSFSPGSGFLFDWFCLFSEMFSAQRQKPNDPSMARQYINQTQSQQRQRENLQNAKLPGNGMMPGNPQQMAAMRNQIMRNNMMNGGPNKMAQSLTPAQIAQMKIMSQQQAAQNQQMQRDGSDMGVNGQRPGTPPDGEHGGSPSKRPRLDGQQQFNGGMVPNGRGQGIPNQGMLMQSGFNPAQMNQAQFRQNGALQQKPMMQGGPVPNGINMGMSTGSPMMGNIDPQFGINGINGMEAMNYNRPPGQAGMQSGPAAQSGNHALQDYQMQLMLLEQQNKKRLMMARQEQDNISRGDGGSLGGQVGMPQGMSPSGSRTGTSPNAMDPMKRGTPQMGMGSPSGGDIQGRSSPVHFMQGQAPDFNTALFMNNKDGLVPGGPNMRQPNMDINALRAQQQNRATGQFPPGQPMIQNPSHGQPQPMGTPGMRNEMPPPSAPPAGASGQRGGQTSSPNSGGAPPTPSQANKPNPKGKKGKEGDNARKRPNKKNSTTNADAADSAAPPTPSTPITPVHPASFGNSGGKGPNAAANAAPTSNPTSQPVQQMPPTDQSSNYNDNFGDSQAFNLDFSTLENPDVLENFDFDSFLNQSGTDDFSADFVGGDLNFMDSVNDG